MNHTPTHRRLNEREAAAELGISFRTLQQWRVRGIGPTYLKIGRSVRYDAASLEIWLAQQTRTNTAG
ncbi:helix-turn-helix domain-containing protein [uncultured Thiocystis sp.]|jgi:predicted DNA-binding transcriptional regulator AlpA|uniref:helix-turn-helix transcriptional regulator n=1 Tax=uncultured Thiocystis sp. TaxID=1202134 RepID=UPI0025F085CD|nr:helix-turn-helix domain-containing protein [uncultured Thiocystis sp.]